MGDQPRRNLPLKILVVMPNWLGDVIMTTPLIDLLHRAFAPLPADRRPEIHLAIRPQWASLFAGDPRITHLLLIEREGRHGGWSGIWRQAQDYRVKNFDVVLLGPPSLRAGLTAALARIPLRVGHATDGRGWLLNCSLAKAPRGSRHYSIDQIDLGLAALAEAELAQVGADSPQFSANILPEPSLWLRDRPADDRPQSDNTQSRRPFWVVAPGTTYGEAKTWPATQVADLMTLVNQQAAAQIVLLGDSGAATFVAQLAKNSDLSWSRNMGDSVDVIDLTGQTDLEQVVDILLSAQAFVGNDSGLMHLAGALGVPTVGVFGSSNPAWTRPLGKCTASVTASGFSCQPCYRKTCPKDVFCLTTVSAAEVFGVLMNLTTKREESGARN